MIEAVDSGSKVLVNPYQIDLSGKGWGQSKNPPTHKKKERTTMYYIFDTKTKINRGWATTKEEAELLLQELSHKWYYRHLVIR